MAYIPKDARWYLADIVLEHAVAGDPRNVVHVNILLIQADSPEVAFEKANRRGRESEMIFTNSDRNEVQVIFRGLRDLNVIHDELEDGAELTYEESIAVPEAKLAGWISAKENLAVFAERKSCVARGTPNLVDELVMKALEDAGCDRENM